MNSELEQYLRHEIEDIKKKILSFAKDIYGEELHFETVRLEESIVYHFGGSRERVLTLYIDTDKGDFRVKKSYPVEDTNDV